MRILLNAIIAKSKSGGGFQISRNFILRSLEDHQIEWYYLISEDLNAEFDSSQIQSSHLFVFPTQPNIKTYLKVACAIRKIEQKIRPDIVYSILSPSYFFFRSPEVMRCCNAWDVIDKNNVAWKYVSKEVTRKFRKKSILSRFLMKRACGFITQTATAKEGILNVTSVNSSKVAVVPNVLPLVFKNCEPIKVIHEGYNILYTATPSPHKNFYCIPAIASILKNQYHINSAKFIVTLPYGSPEIHRLMDMACKLGVDDMIENIGNKKQSELLDVYNYADIGFFPSVLETFSATLLEYMKFGLPIVASDFPFNRDVAGNAAYYFAYDNLQNAAKCINKIIMDADCRLQMQQNGEKRLELFNSFDNYYCSTINALKDFCQ